MEPFGTEEYEIDVDSLLPVLIALGDGHITPRKAAELVEDWMEGTDFREPKTWTWQTYEGEPPPTLSTMMNLLRGQDREQLTGSIELCRYGPSEANKALAKVADMVLALVDEEDTFDHAASCSFIFNS